jgi:hypothetical protein
VIGCQLCHSERSEESLISSDRRHLKQYPEMFRFAQHDRRHCIRRFRSAITVH